MPPEDHIIRDLRAITDAEERAWFEMICDCSEETTGVLVSDIIDLDKVRP